MTRKYDLPNNTKYRPDHPGQEAHLSFTDRERTILQLVAEGMSNREIAERLTLSPTTVKWYVKQIFNKLGANRRTQAVKLASNLPWAELKSPEYEPAPDIPAALTEFIGREKEVNELIRLLHDPGVRLVTIVGAGGIGKTRLALEAARCLAGQMPGLVRFAALDGVTSPPAMIQAIASAIGFQFRGSLDLGRQLLVNLRNRKLVLILDNFEHLLEAAPFIHEMLIIAPRLKILATSRERLNLSAERIYALRGLDYPTTIDHAQEYAAFTLFMQVAHYSQPALQPGSDDVFHICRICQLVEGMPLAIELAARWIDLLTPAQIAEEIVKSVGILQTTRRDLPQRHRSIRAVFERSWQLLSNEERAAFRKLCVFLGSFDRAAAERVAGATLFTLSTLVDKSLLMRVGTDRFKFHELVRQFAEEKLQELPHEYRFIFDEHCRYYASLMEEYEKKIKIDISTVAESILRIEKDYDNILAGWHYTLEMPLVMEVGKYVFSISLFFQTHGLNSEAEQTFNRAQHLFAAHGTSVSTSDRVRLMTHYGWFLLDHDQPESVCQVFEDALKLTPLLDNSHAADVGILLGFLGRAYLDIYPDAAREHAKKGLAICQVANFQMGIWICFAILGEIEHNEGHYEAAYHYQYQALTHSEQNKDLHGMLQSLGHLACTCNSWGKPESALNYLQRELALLRALPTVNPLFLTILGIAGIYEQHDQPEVALELLAILLHHPQYRSPVIKPTVHMLLTHLQSQLSAEDINTVMEKARQGQLSSRFLDPHFTISPELVDHLFELLDEAAKA
ncbi:MAG TPA: LuxR C-terminal-related transcriptional regulator [Anaerolineales bacterium]|nr:LuxR C-terminal-related transcriptional regulator [Anaerolineales bacterium]HLO28823.1 LuxR C-terminal-related transcriptional regulator [Anaerolineales bacterium]